MKLIASICSKLQTTLSIRRFFDWLTITPGVARGYDLFAPLELILIIGSMRFPCKETNNSKYCKSKGDRSANQNFKEMSRRDNIWVY